MTHLSEWLRAVSPRRACLRNTILGGLGWLIALTAGPSWERVLFLLAPLVVVPLGLALIARDDVGRSSWSWRVALWIQLLAALTLLGGFVLPQGFLAAMLSLPWLGLTLLAALAGTLRVFRRGLLPLHELAIDTSLLYLAVGGGWAVLSRAGLQPMGFSSLIVLLTAVHFHYAGFVLPLLTGMAGRVLRSRETDIAAIGVIVGVPLVAVGINLTQLGYRDFEPWAAWFLGAAGMLVALVHLRLAWGTVFAARRWLFASAGVSLLTAMVLAAVYAWGRWTGLPWLDIPEMLPCHGAVNAFGFALAGLLGWNLAPPPPGSAAEAHWPRDTVPRREEAMGTPSGKGLPATTTSRS
jgi:hypothetical protein